MRHPVRKSINKFNEIFNLNEDKYCQDWQIECADEKKLLDFLDGYGRCCDDDDDRFTLMTIILGSYEIYVEEHGHSQEIWKDIRDILIKNKILHQDTIDYWCLREEEDRNNWFIITEYMREI